MTLNKYMLAALRGIDNIIAQAKNDDNIYGLTWLKEHIRSLRVHGWASLNCTPHNLAVRNCDEA